MNQRPRFIGLLLIVLMGISGQVLAQSGSMETQNLTAAFEAYHCEFISSTNQVVVSTSLVGANGLPIPISDVSLSVTPIGETNPLIPDDVAFATIGQRPPLQMIIVLDTTETVPVTEIIGQMVTELFPRLPVEDEVALITFSQEIQPRTAFYTDKNRLVNEHVLDLQVLEGDNRLYAAMLEATTSFQVDSDARRVVLVLSDSGRRESDDTPIEDIVNRAQLNDVQFFPMGFYTLDFPRPNREDFFAIANGTGGYAWFYDQTYISRQDVAEEIGDYLNEFVDALNSEVSITINLQAIDTGSANFLEFMLSADTANDQLIETTVSCPIERLNHRIAFVDDVTNIVVRGTLDVGVVANSDFAADQTTIFFRVDDEVKQDTGETIFTFDTSEYPPDFYEISAELRDTNGNVLAETANTIRVFAQQSLDLSVDGDTTNLSGAVDLILETPIQTDALSVAEFTIAPAANLSDERVLGSAQFDANNIARYTIQNVNQTIQTLYPNAAPEGQYIFGGRVLGVTTSDPLFAVADDVNVNVTEAQQVFVAQSDPIFVMPNWDDEIIWVLIGLVALIINFLLFGAVRRARIRKMIQNQDDYEMSPRVMTATVYVNGVSNSHSLTKRTIYVGRGSGNTINLGSDSNISRSHGVIMWRNGKWLYSNRKPRLLSIINERKKRGLIYHELKPFHEIVIGNALLVFHDNSQQNVSDLVKTNL